MMDQTFERGRGAALIVWLLRLLLVLGLELTAACSDELGKSYPPYRYRLTVEIDTPQGLRRGSSVIEVQTSVAGSNAIPSPGQLFNRIRGQAVAVDLPNGQTLFALLRSDWESDWAKNVYARLAPHISTEQVKARAPDGKWSGDLDFDLWMEQILALRGPQPIPRTWNLMGKDVSNWPMLVRFRDIRDPVSIVRIDPDNLKASFGKSYAIRTITAERTDDAVTGEIGARLAWLKTYRNTMLDGSRLNNSTALANNLSVSDFSEGLDDE